MQTKRSFVPASRYLFDGNGYATIDTEQDATYYGQWIDLAGRRILSYCEGDITIHECDNDTELVDEIKEIIQWHQEREERSPYPFIDPSGADNAKKLIDLGLLNMFCDFDREFYTKQE